MYTCRRYGLLNSIQKIPINLEITALKTTIISEIFMYEKECFTKIKENKGIFRLFAKIKAFCKNKGI